MNWKHIILYALGMTLINCHSVNAQDSGQALSYQSVTQTKNYRSDRLASPTAGRVEFKYPEFVAGAPEQVLTRLNDFIQGYWTGQYSEVDAQHGVDSLATYLLSGFRKEYGDVETGIIGWNDDYEVQITLNKPLLLCLSFTRYSFTGGAHPNREEHSVVLSTKTAEVLSLGDLLVAGYEDSLTAIGEGVFRKIRKLGNTPMSETGFFSHTREFALNCNFAVTADGLEFFFNNYEINGYAAGATRVLIPFADIQRLIRADGPLAMSIK